MANGVKVRRPQQGKAVLKLKKQVADLKILDNVKKEVKFVNLDLFKI